MYVRMYFTDAGSLPAHLNEGQGKLRRGESKKSRKWDPAKIHAYNEVKIVSL